MDRKILVISENVFFNLYKDGLAKYAQDNGDTVDLYYLDYPKKNSNIINKLRYKCDVGGFKKKYYAQLRENLIEKVKAYDVILFINLFYDDEYFIQGKLTEVLKGKDARVFFVDSIKTLSQDVNFWGCFNEIWSFEEQDIAYGREKFGIDIKYVTIGTSYNMFLENQEYNKDIDVCFVGIATEKRLNWLDAVAVYCEKNRLRFWVSGHFWHNNNWLNYHIGEWKFKYKHPVLAKYVQNKFIKPKNLAPIYARSKIVLNINVEYHKSLNQRCFDVMIADSLLLNDKQNVGQLPLANGEDFIMAEDENDMVNKIDFYLKHPEERRRISCNGKQKAGDFFCFKQTLETVLGE